VKGKDIVKRMISTVQERQNASGQFDDVLEGQQDQIVYPDQVVFVSGDGVSPLVNGGEDKSFQKLLVQRAPDLDEQPVEDDSDGSVVSA
jgi:hypothetical protein